MSATPIRVLIVDDQRLVREGIASLLAIQEGITVAGTAVDGSEALAKALDLRPDVVLMDVRMPVMDGIEATRTLRERLPECRILMLTTFDDEDYILKSLLAGASGYLLKDIPADDLAQAVRLAHVGIVQLAPSVAEKLLGQATQGEHLLPRAPEPPAPDLTERELEVLKLLARGATNREIAEALYVSEGTVKNHVSSILSSLGLRDRLQAALYAHEHGLLKKGL